MNATEQKHTAGPWEVVALSGRGGPYSIRMAMPAGSKHPTHYGVQTIGTEANARLIAAAPDLLAALRDAVDLLDQSGFSTKEHCAAIAKAEGAAS